MQRPSLSMLHISLLGAVLWVVAHLAIHLPRGWPFPVRGEWEVLLVSMSMAAGELPPLALGALHGSSPGSYVIALLAAPLIALGCSPLLAGKLLAMALGALMAALCVGLSVSLVGASSSPGTRLWSGALCAVFFAFAWPGLHVDFAGLSGSTPESLVFQVLALVLALASQEGGGKGYALGSGCAVSLAWLLSPLALWTALFVPALWLLPGSQRKRISSRLRLVGWVIVGGVLPVVLLAVLVPGGARGLALFFANDFGSAGLEVSFGGLREHGAVTERAGLFLLFAKVGRALEGGAHNVELAGRAALLAALAWVAFLSVFGTLTSRGTSEDSRPRLVAVLVLSWCLPLSLVPLDFGFYPLAYRYWGVPLSLALVLASVLIASSASSARWSWLRYSPMAVLVLCTAVLLPSLGTSIVAPAVSPPEAVVGTGAHAMDPRPGYPRHAAFLQLSRYAVPPLKRQLSEGYGLALGADSAVSILRGDVPQPMWRELQTELDERAWRALLFGVGCGASTYAAEPEPLLALLFSGPLAEQSDISQGFQSCLAGSRRAFSALEGLPAAASGLNSQVAQPWALLPPRF